MICLYAEHIGGYSDLSIAVCGKGAAIKRTARETAAGVPAGTGSGAKSWKGQVRG